MYLLRRELCTSFSAKSWPLSTNWMPSKSSCQLLRSSCPPTFQGIKKDCSCSKCSKVTHLITEFRALPVFHQIECIVGDAKQGNQVCNLIRIVFKLMTWFQSLIT